MPLAELLGWAEPSSTRARNAWPKYPALLSNLIGNRGSCESDSGGACVPQASIKSNAHYAKIRCNFMSKSEVIRVSKLTISSIVPRIALFVWPLSLAGRYLEEGQDGRLQKSICVSISS